MLDTNIGVVSEARLWAIRFGRCFTITEADGSIHIITEAY